MTNPEQARTGIPDRFREARARRSRRTRWEEMIRQRYERELSDRDQASVTEDRARVALVTLGDGLPPIVSPVVDLAREALRIFADDLTDESAARLRAVVDAPDGYKWGGLV